MGNNNHAETGNPPGIINLLRSNKLLREISVVLFIKLLLIYVLWFSFFKTENQPPVTIHTIDEKILGQPSRIDQDHLSPSKEVIR